MLLLGQHKGKSILKFGNWWHWRKWIDRSISRKERKGKGVNECEIENTAESREGNQTREGSSKKKETAGEIKELRKRKDEKERPDAHCCTLGLGKRMSRSAWVRISENKSAQIIHMGGIEMKKRGSIVISKYIKILKHHYVYCRIALVRGMGECNCWGALCLVAVLHSNLAEPEGAHLKRKRRGCLEDKCWVTSLHCRIWAILVYCRIM